MTLIRRTILCLGLTTTIVTNPKVIVRGWVMKWRAPATLGHEGERKKKEEEEEEHQIPCMQFLSLFFVFLLSSVVPSMLGN